MFDLVDGYGYGICAISLNISRIYYFKPAELIGHLQYFSFYASKNCYI